MLGRKVCQKYGAKYLIEAEKLKKNKKATFVGNEPVLIQRNQTPITHTGGAFSENFSANSAECINMINQDVTSLHRCLPQQSPKELSPFCTTFPSWYQRELKITSALARGWQWQGQGLPYVQVSQAGGCAQAGLAPCPPFRPSVSPLGLQPSPGRLQSCFPGAWH